VKFDDGRVEKVERKIETETRFGDEIKREQQLERKDGYVEYEGKTKTSWGREVKVNAVAGRDVFGRPVGSAYVDTKHRGEWGVAQGPYGNRLVTSVPSYYRPVSYWGVPYYHYGGVYYGSYRWRGYPYYYPAYPPYGAVYYDFPAGAVAITLGVAAASYYYHDHVYYKKTYSEGEVSYKVVPAPAGAEVQSLPAGTATVSTGGKTFYYHNNAFYRLTTKDSKSVYVVVEAPGGTSVRSELPADFEPFPVGQVTFFTSQGQYFLSYVKDKKEVYLLVDEPAEARAQVTQSVPQTGSPATAHLAPISINLVAQTGTLIRVRTAEEWITATSKVGDPFIVYLDGDLTVDGKIIAQQGAIVYGRISSVESSKLTAILTEISIGDGLIPIRCSPLTLGPESVQAAQVTNRNVSLSDVVSASPRSNDGNGFALPSESILSFKLVSPLRVQSLVASR
jgi:hypothetical protein